MKLKALLAMACLPLLAGCSAAPRDATRQAWNEYLEVLDRLQSATPPLPAGSPEERQAIARFQNLLADFKAPGFAAGIGEVYAREVFFNDTLKTLRGVEEVEEHLRATADALEEGSVEFVDLVNDDGDYYFRWTMTVRYKRLARGEPIFSAGMTHVRFDADGKVVLHQDFWDAAGGFYEHVPAAGWLIRRVKNRI